MTTNLFSLRSGHTDEKVRDDEFRDLSLAALDEISARGNLLKLVPDRPQRLALTNYLGAQGLVTWNKAIARYELTPLAKQFLADYHREVG